MSDTSKTKPRAFKDMEPHIKSTVAKLWEHQSHTTYRELTYGTCIY